MTSGRTLLLRLQMLVIAATAGGAGFLFDAATKARFGMGVRWALAALVAYAVFLFLLFCLRHVRDVLDFLGNAFDMVTSLGRGTRAGSGSSPRGDPSWNSGGGRYGGGGSSGRFDGRGGRGGKSLEPPESLAELPRSRSSSSLDLPDLDLPGDEAAIPLLLVVVLIAILAGIFIAVGGLVWMAPELFAELALDGVIAGGLYRGLARNPREHWLETALRRTAWRFALVAVLLGAGGFALQQAAPEAVGLRDAIAHLRR